MLCVDDTALSVGDTNDCNLSPHPPPELSLFLIVLVNRYLSVQVQASQRGVNFPAVDAPQSALNAHLGNWLEALFRFWPTERRSASGHQHMQ